MRYRDLGSQIPSEVGWEKETASAGMGARVDETLPGDMGQKNPFTPARGTAAPLLLSIAEHPSQPHPAGGCKSFQAGPGPNKESNCHLMAVQGSDICPLLS